MRTAQDYEVQRQYDAGTADMAGAGWVVFAAVMLGLAGLWSVIEGIAAISSAHVYVAGANYVFSDLNTWGWIVLILGIAEGIAAFMLLSGSELARWFGVAVAGVNAIGQLMFVPAFPLWGLAMFSVDILIIYGLVAYGGSRLRQA